MDKAALVSLDIDRGREVVEALERAGQKVSIALWLYLPEYDDWRLVVSARQLGSLTPRNAYRLLNDSLAAAGLAPGKTVPVLILPTSDPLIKDLRQRFGKARSVEGLRLGGQMIGDRFVQDAYVYRIS